MFAGDFDLFFFNGGGFLDKKCKETDFDSVIVAGSS